MHCNSQARTQLISAVIVTWSGTLPLIFKLGSPPNDVMDCSKNQNIPPHAVLSSHPYLVPDHTLHFGSLRYPTALYNCLNQ